MKNHEIALVVNQLRDIAIEFRDAAQLRARIAEIVVPLLQNEHSIAAPTPAAQNAGQEAIYQVRTSVSGWADLTPEQFEDSNLDKRIVYAASVSPPELVAHVRKLVNGEILDSTGCPTRWEDLPDGTPIYANVAPVNGGEREELRAKVREQADKIAELHALLDTAQVGDMFAADAQQVGKDAELMCKRLRNMELMTCGEAADLIERLAALTSPAKVGGDPAEPRDDSDREYAKPIGYLPAHELGRLHSGHSANLRSAKFGPSALDGDVPVYLQSAKVGGDEREAFEHWASDEGEYPVAIERSGPGYKLQQTQTYWVAWQDACKWQRAALSADSGEDKRDAERLDWLMQHVCADEIEGIRSLPYGIDMDEYLHLFREAIDAAIAANQAKE